MRLGYKILGWRFNALCGLVCCEGCRYRLSEGVVSFVPTWYGVSRIAAPYRRGGSESCSTQASVAYACHRT